MSNTDRCLTCRQEMDQEWVPPVILCGKPLAGTGVWRSALTEGHCDRCRLMNEDTRRQERRIERLRDRFIRLVGGIKPYRDFTFERYGVTAGNRIAVHWAAEF